MLNNQLRTADKGCFSRASNPSPKRTACYSGGLSAYVRTSYATCPEVGHTRLACCASLSSVAPSYTRCRILFVLVTKHEQLAYNTWCLDYRRLCVMDGKWI